ncbi:MAG: adenylate/guanylate cyclase domain-containing protein [Gammaproteobacteria bacterium]
MAQRNLHRSPNLVFVGLTILALCVYCALFPIDVQRAMFLAAALSFASDAVRRLIQHIEHSTCLRAFVSPNVAQQMRRQGTKALDQDIDADISIICADIRNFTAFSASIEPREVMQFMREYYEAVGKVVRQFDGTIKDYAGDGILVLIGAPQPMHDHASRAVNMAVAIRKAALSVTARWSTDAARLGIGIGVASGPVTLGVVGGAERREYAAVGPAVNLAARLCSKARCSEILLNDDTLGRAREQRCHVPAKTRIPLMLKGFADEVSVASC